MEPNLIHLQELFASWNGSSKKRHSNPSLRAQAVKCLDHYSQREVSAACGVSTNTLRSWKESLLSNSAATTSIPLAFAPINLGNIQDTGIKSEEPLSLQIHLSSGIAIHVNSEDIKALVGFVVTLNKESSACSI